MPLSPIVHVPDPAERLDLVKRLGALGYVLASFTCTPDDPEHVCVLYYRGGARIETCRAHDVEYVLKMPDSQYTCANSIRHFLAYLAQHYPVTQ